MTDPTAPQMPMGRVAAKLSTPPLPPPLSLPPGGAMSPPPAAAPALAMPPMDQAAPAMPPQGMPAAPMGNPFPAPDAPSAPPYQVELQDDGSSVYSLPPQTPGGKPIIIGINPPPKLPKALQPKQPPIQ